MRARGLGGNAPLFSGDSFDNSIVAKKNFVYQSGLSRKETFDFRDQLRGSFFLRKQGHGFGDFPVKERKALQVSGPATLEVIDPAEIAHFCIREKALGRFIEALQASDLRSDQFQNFHVFYNGGDDG